MAADRVVVSARTRCVVGATSVAMAAVEASAYRD